MTITKDEKANHEANATPSWEPGLDRFNRDRILNPHLAKTSDDNDPRALLYAELLELAGPLSNSEAAEASRRRLSIQATDLIDEDLGPGL